MLTQNSILYKGMTKWHLLVTRSSVRDLGSKGEQNGMTTSLSKCSESEAVKILRDFKIQTDYQIVQNKPDIIVLGKQSRSCLIIDVVCPFDACRLRVGNKRKWETVPTMKTRN